MWPDFHWFPYRFQRAWTVLCSMKHPLDVVRVGAWNSLWLDSGLNWHHIWPSSEQLNVYTDACSEAGRAFCLGNWFYVQRPSDVPSLTVHHINTKELPAVVMAAQVWCQNWANHHIVIHTDNQATKAGINNGTARNNMCLDLFKHLASMALEFNFTSALYIHGIDNSMADTTSHLHEPSKRDLLANSFNAPFSCAIPYGGMSLKSQHVLFEGLTHWGRETHICVGEHANIGSDNGLSLNQRQAIIWTNAGILLIGPSGTNFNVILIEIYMF